MTVALRSQERCSWVSWLAYFHFPFDMPIEIAIAWITKQSSTFASRNFIKFLIRHFQNLSKSPMQNDSSKASYLRVNLLSAVVCNKHDVDVTNRF